MAPSAADIPSLFDVIIDGVGYREVDQAQIDVGRYTLKQALFQFTPTFVERQNVQGDYGDNQQDFWLTWTQRDWGLGNQSRYYRASNGNDRRYWKDASIDVRIAGQVSLRSAVKSITFPATARSCWNAAGRLFAVGSTNLYEVASDGTVTDRGAHGSGTPGVFSLASDLDFLYIAGGTRITKYNLGANTFSSFSASVADSLAFINNALYGYRQTTGDLVRWDTSGTITTGLASFKDATGGIYSQVVKLAKYGGKLILLRLGEDWGPQLWSYDGTGVSLIAEFPPTFSPNDMCVVAGTLFISGTFNRYNSGGTQQQKPVIYYYNQAGQSNVLWQGYDYGTTIGAPGICPFDDGLAFIDAEENKLMWFDPTGGGVHAMGVVSGSGFVIQQAASDSFMLMTRNGTGGFIYPDRSGLATSGTIDHSLADLDTSLTKYFKGVKIDADIPANTSVDVAYLTDDLTTSYTNVQTGITQGVEYPINASGRAISIRVTLNKGTGTSSPILKRVYVRAVPVQQTFKMNQYVLDLSGNYSKADPQFQQLRNTMPYGGNGQDLAVSFLTSAIKTVPIVIIDRFGQYNGVVDLTQTEVHQLRPGEYYANIVVRETG